MSQPLDKKTLASLIDAYADAKASKNQYLQNMMVSQVQLALDSLFGDTFTPEGSVDEA